MAGARIMLVDDDSDTRTIFRDKLEHAGFEIAEAESAEDALGKVAAFDPALIISDIRMDEMTGLELLERVRASMPAVDVIVMTAHEDMESTVAAMKAGAFDYLVKPVSLSTLVSVVERCLGDQALSEEAEEDPHGDHADPIAGSVVGRDPRMIEIYKTIGALAGNRTTVLIRGETGTGKEVIARAIHQYSEDSAEPFIAVNCTALTDSLLESELFGHVKGAFTGAVGARKGYFELAGSGTIFLDEIGDTEAGFQTKLLRVLQERQFYPVGGEEPRRTEARVVAATHQPMEELVAEGGFREDLYFRLKVVEIYVPGLRERPTDIPLLCNHLMAKIRREMGQGPTRISGSAMEQLEAYDWPGNVRELENALTRAAIVARGAVIGPDHLALGTSANRLVPMAGSDRGTDQALDDVIRAHVNGVLKASGGNKSEAAGVLGISRSRLAGYVKKFGL